VPLLLLIRHAVTETTGTILYGQSPGLSLSDRGREQAAALAERLEPVPIAALYASPLERCVETAEPIAAAAGLKVDLVPGLMEADAGEWTGRKLAELRRLKAWRGVMAAPSRFRFPGGESMLEVETRVVSAVDSIVAEHPEGVVAVVAHADPIRLLLAHFAGAHVDHFQRWVVAPASVSAVAVPEGGGPPMVLAVNHTGSLAEVLPKPPKRGLRR
jgi:probable phosphoglycerate mutase